MSFKNIFTLSGTSLAVLAAQQYFLKNIQISKPYRQLLTEIQQQLKMTNPSIKLSELQAKSVQELHQQYHHSLKKKTVQKLSLVADIRKQQMLNKHILAQSIISLGLFILPQPFRIISYGYLSLYQIHFFNKLTKFRFDKQLPFAYNFDSIHFFYCIGASVVLLWGIGYRLALKAQQMQKLNKQQGKNIIVKESEEVVNKNKE